MNCSQCGKEFSYGNRNRHYCHECEDLRRKATQYRYYKKWYEENGRNRNKKKQHAMSLVYRAVRGGELRRRKTCQMCKSASRKIEGHHQDYNQPLNVVWLCNMCHSRIHAGYYKERLYQLTKGVS